MSRRLAALTIAENTNEDFRTLINTRFKPFFDLVGKIKNDLEALGITNATLDIRLPRIVVVGCESAGKSSVIERLASFRFFPRGRQITTRMPIKLRLIHKTKKEMKNLARENNLDYDHGRRTPFFKVLINGQMQFIHLSDPSVLEGQIQIHMNQVTSGTGIITEEFIIEIISTEVTDVELIDLPGIFSGIVPGEAANLPQLSRDLTQSYVRDSNTFVVAIVPANERIRNNQIMGIIQAANAERRTICALTKCDLTVPVDSVIKKVNGNAEDTIHLQPHGYVGIVNGNNQNVEIGTISASEDEFFRRFEAIAGVHFYERVGIIALSRKISEGFQQHLNSRFPTFRVELQTIRVRVQISITELGERVVPENQQNHETFRREFCIFFTNSIQRCKDRVLAENINFNQENLYGAITNLLFVALTQEMGNHEVPPWKFGRFNVLTKHVIATVHRLYEEVDLTTYHSRMGYVSNMEFFGNDFNGHQPVQYGFLVLR